VVGIARVAESADVKPASLPNFTTTRRHNPATLNSKQTWKLASVQTWLQLQTSHSFEKATLEYAEPHESVMTAAPPRLCADYGTRECRLPEKLSAPTVTN
jgi:hypothetical protein